MAKEMERKFLVKAYLFTIETSGKHLRQGYIANDSNNQVRVRIEDDRAYLTIKGKRQGIKRPEYEYNIPISEAEELLDTFCSGKQINKIRYYINYAGHIWSVDKFMGDNEGLLIAEIELKDENEYFERPDWVGEEVTDDERYYNKNLLDNPYINWKTGGVHGQQNTETPSEDDEKHQ